MMAFIDESGDHNLDIKKADNNYNVFVLGTVLIEKTEYPKIDAEFKAFKKSFFGDENFIIHTAELIRPMHKDSDPRNKVMLNKDKRSEFYEFMSTWLTTANFRASFAVIKKTELTGQYITPVNPYDFCFENLLNRIMYYSKSSAIEIYPECRDSNLDKRLTADFKKYFEVGIAFYKAKLIQERVRCFELKKKEENLTGLQIADLLVSPVGRHFLGKNPRVKGNEIPYSVVSKKLAGYLALTVFPS
ncbi:MAG: DUF3800 domain-containing protein [Patescibacteria group bacterium]